MPSTVNRPYFRGVDGLRGFAIISVLFYHAGITSRGLFGVDIFFVISGFLATLLMMRDLQSVRPRWISRFYGRRVKRLLPGVTVSLVAVMIFVGLLGTSDELSRAVQTSMFSMLQVENWYQLANNQSYWDATGFINPLGQMWSLSVTEQFYIVWPIIIGILWYVARRNSARFTLSLIGLTILAACVAPLMFDGTNSDRLYLGTDSRAVAFLAGAAAAAIVSPVRRRRSAEGADLSGPRMVVLLNTLSIGSAVGLVIASALVSSYRDDWIYEGGLAVVAVLAATLTATACHRGLLLTRLFSLAPLPGLGRLAWTLFIFHLPVYWFIQVRSHGQISGWALFLLGAPATFLVAGVVHRWIAEPLRLRRWTRSSATIAVICSFVLIAGTAFALPLVKDSLLAQKGPAKIVSSVATIAPDADGGPPKAVLVGDSLANDFSSALGTYANDQIVVSDSAWGGCGLLDPEGARTAQGYTESAEDIRELCWPWKDKLIAQLDPGDTSIVIVHNGWDVVEQILDGQWIGPCSQDWKKRYRQKIESLVAVTTASPSNPTILLSTERVDSVLASDKNQLTCFNEAILESVKEYPSVRLLDFNQHLCPEGECRVSDAQGNSLFYDGVHFTEEGKAWITPWLLENIADAQESRTD